MLTRRMVGEMEYMWWNGSEYSSIIVLIT